MAANSSEFLFYCHDCMPSILNNFCVTYNQWCCRGGRRPLLNFESQCYFQYDTTKKVINFRGYSLIHIKADQLDSLKKFCILSEHFIFHEKIRTQQVATLPMEPFGTQSPSKCQHIHFLGQKLTDMPIWSTVLSSNL